METYIFDWYDKDTEKRTVMRLNEEQVKLLNYLFNVLNFEEILEVAEIRATLSRSTSDDIVDLT